MKITHINIISILIPLVVLVLFQVKLPGNFSYLPHIYAPINAVVALLLISAVIAIKQGKVKLHKWLINTSILLSILFLLMYIVYHATTKETKYPDASWFRYVYYFLLFTHIMFSVITIPIVLRAYYYASIGNLVKHKKFTKYAFPFWLYVAISGVLIYIIISPYYPNVDNTQISNLTSHISHLISQILEIRF